MEELREASPSYADLAERETVDDVFEENAKLRTENERLRICDSQKRNALENAYLAMNPGEDSVPAHDELCRQVGVGIKRMLDEIADWEAHVDMGPWGTCDWGDCDREATRWRYAEPIATHLPVCVWHSLEEESKALRDAIEGILRAIDSHHPKFAHGPFTLTRTEIEACRSALGVSTENELQHFAAHATEGAP